jgi:Multiubiquitin
MADELAKSPNEHGNHEKHKILINDKEYVVEAKTLSGAQIKALAGIPAEYQLFLEQPGEDRPIPDATSVKLHDGMKFYSLPPATFG